VNCWRCNSVNFPLILATGVGKGELLEIVSRTLSFCSQILPKPHECNLKPCTHIKGYIFIYFSQTVYFDCPLHDRQMKDMNKLHDKQTATQINYLNPLFLILINQTLVPTGSQSTYSHAMKWKISSPRVAFNTLFQ
jgi:hypothetical protein